MAVVVAFLNDARFRAGKPAMGFVNPWLYSVAGETLNDIVYGGSTGCYYANFYKGAAHIPWASWNATKGW